MAQRQESLLDRITTNPGILSGKPIIRGTRMPVWVVIEKIEFGETNEEIIYDFPFLATEDVDAVRLFMERTPGSTEIRKLR